jgi:hypothetical protein
MHSLKCPQCGLVNFASDLNCKRCNFALASTPAPSPIEMVIAPPPPVNHAPTQAASNCPGCGSQETRSFEMAYATSTSTGNLRTLSYNFNIGATIGGGAISQTSGLAAYVVPPTPPFKDNTLANALTVLATLFLLISLLVLSLDSEVKPFFFIVLIGSMGTLSLAVPKLRINATERFNYAKYRYGIAFEQWRRSWICLRCGFKWMR